jgi:glutaredoxin-like YruB-family protein
MSDKADTAAVPITIYSADWCAFCHAAKDYLDKKGIAYTDKNVEADPANAQEAMDKSDQTGIPVIDIDGTIIIGFDKPTIDDTLKKKKLV